MSDVQLPEAVPVADTGLAPTDVLRESGGEPGGSRISRVGREIVDGNVLVTALAVVLALLIGGILIVLTNPDVQAASAYFFSRPSDTIVAVGNALGGSYSALFRGGIFDYTAGSFAAGIVSLTNSIGYATPLIAAGLALAIGFRTGVFNIGGQGQILIAGAFGGLVGFDLSLPPVIHVVVAVLAALVGGALWAGLVGVLKARTGAHEVIVTIMLNYIAYYLIDYLLHTPVLRAPGSQNPISPSIRGTAVLAPLAGSDFPGFNIGFPLVIAATLGCAWLLSRSSLGFRLRAVGENPRAARVAGIDVNRMVIIAMVISGVLMGFAGAYQVLSQLANNGFGNDLDAGIGLSAITVSLLGRSRPWGVFAAGLAFGILQAGGTTLQAAQGVDVNIVGVIQSLIVLFIAAPPLVRAIFRIRRGGRAKPRPRRGSKAVVA